MVLSLLIMLAFLAQGSSTTDRVIVVSDGVSAAESAAVSKAAQGATTVERLPETGSVVLKVPDGTSPEHVAAGLNEQPGIRAYVDSIIEPAAWPNDQLRPRQYYHDYTRVSSVWASQKGGGTPVCVIDSGIDLTHPDLENRISNKLRKNVLDNSDQVQDVFGHGSLIAGVLGAQGNNGIGIVGTAPQLSMVPCKFMNDSGAGYASHAAECLYWCKANKVWFATAAWVTSDANGYLLAAIQDYTAAGGFIAAAAGNGKRDLDARPETFPACFKVPGMLAVAASDRADRQALAPYTNYGKTIVALAAPGTHILTTSHKTNARYKEVNGTSVVVPQVVAAAVLAYKASKSRNLRGQQLAQHLVDNVDKVSSLSTKLISSGLLNVQKAVENAAEPSSPPSPRPKSKKLIRCTLTLFEHWYFDGRSVSWTSRWKGYKQANKCEDKGSLQGVVVDGMDFNDATSSMRISCTCNRHLDCLQAGAGVNLTLYQDVSWWDTARVTYYMRPSSSFCSSTTCLLEIPVISPPWNDKVSAWRMCLGKWSPLVQIAATSPASDLASSSQGSLTAAGVVYGGVGDDQRIVEKPSVVVEVNGKGAAASTVVHKHSVARPSPPPSPPA